MPKARAWRYYKPQVEEELQDAIEAVEAKAPRVKTAKDAWLMGQMTPALPGAKANGTALQRAGLSRAYAHSIPNGTGAMLAKCPWLRREP